MTLASLFSKASVSVLLLTLFLATLVSARKDTVIELFALDKCAGDASPSTWSPSPSDATKDGNNCIENLPATSVSSIIFLQLGSGCTGTIYTDRYCSNNTTAARVDVCTGLPDGLTIGSISIDNCDIPFAQQSDGTSTTSTASPASTSTTSSPAQTSTAASIAPSSSNQSKSSGLSTGAQAGIGVGVAVGVLALFGIIGMLLRRRKLQTERRHFDEDQHGGTGVEKPLEKRAVVQDGPQELHGTALPTELAADQPIPELPTEQADAKGPLSNKSPGLAQELEGSHSWT